MCEVVVEASGHLPRIWLRNQSLIWWMSHKICARRYDCHAYTNALSTVTHNKPQRPEAIAISFLWLSNEKSRLKIFELRDGSWTNKTSNPSAKDNKNSPPLTFADPGHYLHLHRPLKLWTIEYISGIYFIAWFFTNFSCFHVFGLKLEFFLGKKCENF